MRSHLQPVIVFGLVLIAAFLLFAGYTINIYSPMYIAGVAGLLVLFIATIYEVRIGLFVLLFFTIFSPEVLAGAGNVGGRGVTFRLDDIIIITIFIAWLARMAFVAEKGTWRKTPLNFLLVLYIFFNIFSSLNGVYNETVNPRITLLFTGKKIEYICIFFLVVNSIESLRDVKMFFIVSLLVCGTTCIWGLYMIGTGQVVGRFAGPFDVGEANTIAAYFVMHMSLAVGMIFNYKGSFWKSFPLYLLILLIFIPFALTFSRGGYVAMLASMIVIACFKGHRIIFLPIAVFLLMMKFVLPPEIMDRILTIGSIVTPGSDVRVEAWDDRLGMWTRALYRWQKRPLLGMGPGSFDLGGVDNQYFMELATVGTIGLAIFLLIIGLILFITVRVFMQTKDPFIRNVSIGFFAGTIGYIVNGMSMSTFILIRTMQPFYVHVGLLCFVYRALVLERSGDAESGEKALSPPDFAQ